MSRSNKIEPFRLVIETGILKKNAPVIRQMLDEGWCRSFILAHKLLDTEIIKWAVDEDFALFLSMPGSRKKSRWLGNDTETSEKLAMNEVQKLESLHKARPGNAFWELFVEEDSAGYTEWTQNILAQPPLTHTEAAKRFSNHLKKVIDETRDYGTMPRVGLFGFASSCHYGAQAGLDMVWIERGNDETDDHQTAIAFARGASRQYGIKWGIDFSLYWSPVRGISGYGSYLTRGYYSTYFTRHYYLAYFAGADMFRLEGGKELFTEDWKRLTKLGEVVRNFSLFTQKHPDRGTPDVPVAFLLPVDHGWITPPYWRTENTVWNYARVPYRPGDFQMDGLFSLAFPGSNFYQECWPFGSFGPNNPSPQAFSLGYVPAGGRLPEKAKPYQAPYPLPFGRFFDRKDAIEAVGKGLDTRPYRPMGDTRWGDIIDVLLADAPSEVLRQYPLVVLCGPIRVEDELKQRLIDYVKTGGTLVVSAGQVGPEDSDLVGAELEPMQRVGRAWVWDSELTVEHFHYLLSRPISAKVLAKTNNNEPLVYQNSLAKGKVYTCTIPYMGNAISPLAGVAKRLMDEVIGKVQPVRVKGLPVEWMSSRGENFCNVVIANHDDSLWKGTIEVRKVDFAIRGLKELRFQKDMKMRQNDSSVTFETSVPAYDVRIYRIQ